MNKFIQFGFMVFLSSLSMAQIPNADFEEVRSQPGIKNWGAIFVFPFPPSCDSIMIDKELYFLNDEPHSGEHALELRNGYCSETRYAGRASVMESDTDYATFASGVPYSGRPKDFAFFYKFIQAGDDLPPGTDTAIASLVLLNTDENIVVATASKKIWLTTQGYTEAIVPIVYESLLPVTSALIEFNNRTETSTITFGTRFLIDDVELRGVANSVKTNKVNASHVSLSPNPTTNSVTFTSTSDAHQTLTIYSIDGKQVYQTSLLHKATVDCSRFSKGSYVYQVDEESGQFIVN